MPLSSIVLVLLRLSALNWLVGGLVQLATGLFAFPSETFSIVQIAAPAVLIPTAILVWVSAPFLSRLFTKGADGGVSLEGVSLESLYSTAFVGIGLWFALGNFASVFNWIHYYVAHAAAFEETKAHAPASFYNLSDPALTFLAGVALVATARIWARKLTKENDSAARG